MVNLNMFMIMRTLDSQVISKTGINYIQLHAKWKPEDVYNLKKSINHNLDYLKTICVIEPVIPSESYINELLDISDFLLMDYSYRGGTGKNIELRMIEKIINLLAKTKVFIAGGLNVNNVANYIKEFEPYGVDVQTGVEKEGEKGIKDKNKILKFKQTVYSVSASNLAV